MHYGAVLQFYGNRLVVELHKKPGAHSQKESIIGSQTATSFQSSPYFSREEQNPSLGQNGRRNQQNAFQTLLSMVTYRLLKKLRIRKAKKERERSPEKTYLTSFMLPNTPLSSLDSSETKPWYQPKTVLKHSPRLTRLFLVPWSARPPCAG